MDELKRFENDLKGSEELRKKLDETAARLKNEGQVKSDGELLVAAAKEMGYDFSIADLEKSTAEAEPLDQAEMESVAGGAGWRCGQFYLFNGDLEDEHGHDTWCVTLWHCLSATLHTEANETEASCWSNYKCWFVTNYGLFTDP